jgi:hypothetical protein
VKNYSLVHDESGDEVPLTLDADEAEESRRFWSLIGWTLLEVPE